MYVADALGTSIMVVFLKPEDHDTINQGAPQLHPYEPMLLAHKSHSVGIAPEHLLTLYSVFIMVYIHLLRVCLTKLFRCLVSVYLTFSNNHPQHNNVQRDGKRAYLVFLPASRTVLRHSERVV